MLTCWYHFLSVDVLIFVLLTCWSELLKSWYTDLTFDLLNQLVIQFMICGSHFSIVDLTFYFRFFFCSILDSQLSWESGKFQLPRWSHEVVWFFIKCVTSSVSCAGVGWTQTTDFVFDYIIKGRFLFKGTYLLHQENNTNKERLSWAVPHSDLD